jgi:cytidylate kinase
LNTQHPLIPHSDFRIPHSKHSDFRFPTSAFKMIITIDGPAGAGKSTVARGLARQLGFQFLDTGATYRAVALAALRRGLPWDNSRGLVRLAGKIRIELVGERVLLDGEDVTEDIRTSEVTEVTHYAADNPGVRNEMVTLQRRLAAERDVVTEGRDQGTVVFPHASCKIFLTASPAERAGRRMRELKERGEDVSLAHVLASLQQRDERDSCRSVGPLKSAEDAVEVVTDGMTADEVVSHLQTIATRRRAEKEGSAGCE